jgi:hypothetical protein
MPESLSDYFMVAVSALVGDFTVFGMWGLEEFIGHGNCLH